MSLLHFHPLQPFSSSINPKPKPNHKFTRPSTLPARDLTIDFGRHKGRMLGSLPSSYLTWISSTLRAAESLHWAHLADEVLSDPIYRDRIEWEFAQNLLSGNSSNTRPASANPVSDLLELSQRFGWDNEDREGWARVDFELLGTSKGGRIPRIVDRGDGDVGADEKQAMRVAERRSTVGGSGKREERRERRRARSGQKSGVEANEGRLEMLMMTAGEKKTTGVNGNPFPGRGAFLDKIARGED